MDRVIESCAEGSGWTRTGGKWEAPEIEQPEEPHLRRGIGFACGFKNVGFSFGYPEECWATVELHGRAEIEEVVLRHAGAEVGQGAHTALMQMAAEAAGVPLSKVRLVPSDTATSENSGSASASRMTFMAGHAIRGAVEAAMVKWQEEDRPAIAKYQYRPPPTTSYDSETGQAEPNFAYGYVAEAATVEVDTEIGAVRILDVVCADDVGRVINPQGVQGQIEGAIVQAAGYAILEDFKQEGGQVQTGRLSTYLIPGIWDIPERVHPIILEYEDPGGPWGVRGMAEMPFIPLTPAVTAAIYNALGVWYDEFPLTPERVLWGIHDADSE